MTLAEINERIRDIDGELTELSNGVEERSAEGLKEAEARVDALVTEREGLVRESITLRAQVAPYEPVIETGNKHMEDKHIMARKGAMYATEEYRTAFMNYVLYGERSDVLTRADASTTDTTGAVIVPTTVTSKLYKVDPTAGQVYGLVTKTSYNAGMVLPVGEIEPELKWLAERTPASNTDVGAKNITFTGYKAQIKVVISYELDVMSLSEFETMIVAKINEAVSKGFDKAIVSGTGDGQPTGILASASESGVKTYGMTDIDSYDEWLEAYKLVPVSERAGLRLFINRADMLGHLYSTKDNAGKVAVINSVDRAGFFTYSFMGVPIVEIEDCGLGEAADGGIFAFFFNPTDYYLNINSQPTLKTYTDESTDDIVTKVTLLADGKVVDTDSLVFVSAGVSPTSTKKS